MSDARWFEVEADLAASVEHFGRSVTLHDLGGFDGGGLDAYRARMALMHAMQSRHTSLEAALVRILDLLHEDVPTGRDWHADLLRRVSHALMDRPAILPPSLAQAANETRRFRHVAMRSYGDFDPARAQPAIAAAALIAHGLAAAVLAFRRQIDPDHGATP